MTQDKKYEIDGKDECAYAELVKEFDEDAPQCQVTDISQMVRPAYTLLRDVSLTNTDGVQVKPAKDVNSDLVDRAVEEYFMKEHGITVVALAEELQPYSTEKGKTGFSRQYYSVYDGGESTEMHFVKVAVYNEPNLLIDEGKVQTDIGNKKPGLVPDVYFTDALILPSGDTVEVMCMEYLNAPTFRTSMKDKTMTIEDKLSLFIKVAQAIEEEHDAGYVHRDLKPETIMVLPDRIVLLDQSFASRKGELPRNKIVCGTAHYLSPEHYKLEDPVSPKLDVYSLGCMLYEMFTGKVPHADAIKSSDKKTPSSLELLSEGLWESMKTEKPLKEAPESFKALDENLKFVITHCLKANPEERYASPIAVAYSLSRVLNGIKEFKELTNSVLQIMTWSEKPKTTQPYQSIQLEAPSGKRVEIGSLVVDNILPVQGSFDDAATFPYLPKCGGIKPSA